MSSVHICDNIQCPNIGTLLCSRCKNGKYCSIQCQKAHWNHHKYSCDRLCKLGIEKNKTNKIIEQIKNKNSIIIHKLINESINNKDKGFMLIHWDEDRNDFEYDPIYLVPEKSDKTYLKNSNEQVERAFQSFDHKKNVMMVIDSSVINSNLHLVFCVILHITK